MLNHTKGHKTKYDKAENVNKNTQNEQKQTPNDLKAMQNSHRNAKMSRKRYKIVQTHKVYMSHNEFSLCFNFLFQLSKAEERNYWNKQSPEKQLTAEFYRQIKENIHTSKQLNIYIFFLLDYYTAYHNLHLSLSNKGMKRSAPHHILSHHCHISTFILKMLQT